MSQATNRGGGSGEGTGAPCVDCGSRDTRPSGSSYPLDREKTANIDGSFWRCSNCGARFLGPKAHSQKKRHRSHHGSGRLDHAVDRERALKRWIFPVLAILTTVLVVFAILTLRNPRGAPVIQQGR